VYDTTCGVTESNLAAAATSYEERAVESTRLDASVGPTTR
jgi:hypothetical protein